MNGLLRQLEEQGIKEPRVVLGEKMRIAAISHIFFGVGTQANGELVIGLRIFTGLRQAEAVITGGYIELMRKSRSVLVVDEQGNHTRIGGESVDNVLKSYDELLNQQRNAREAPAIWSPHRSLRRGMN